MKPRGISIFIAGCLVGCGVTWFGIQAAQRSIQRLFASQPLELKVQTSEAAPEDASLTFEYEDIRTAFQRLARAANLNLTVSEKVQGSVTLELDPTRHSPRDAIEIIALSKGLILDDLDGKLFVKTQEERAKEPTQRMHYTFRNARASEVKALLVKSLQSPAEPLVDERTNTIFYREARSNIARIQEFLDLLDRPLPIPPDDTTADTPDDPPGDEPAPEPEAGTQEVFQANGPFIFQNEDIRQALQRLAKAGNLDLVISDKVQGTITLANDPSENQSPRFLIDIIVTAKGLILDELDGKLFVKTVAERAREPTVAATYTFRHRRASDAIKIVAKSLQSGVDPVVDERTNTIFYREVRSNVSNIHEVLEFLDKPVPPPK